MREIDRLRSEAIKRTRNAGQKISRVKRNTGLDLSGTSSDPRLPLDRIRSMRTRELRPYINRLNGFLDRGTQFAVSAMGKPISSQVWERYKRAERSVNALARAHLKPIKGVKLPGMVRTVDQQLKYERENMLMTTDALNRPLIERNMKPNAFFSESAVIRVTRALEARLKPNFYNRALNKQRKNAIKMYKVIGNSEMLNFIKGLRDSDFDIAWNYGKLATSGKIRYDAAKASDEGRDIPSGFAKLSGEESAEVEKWQSALFHRAWDEAIKEQNKRNRKGRRG